MSTTAKGKGRQSVWTDEIIGKMLELWMEGKSASNIARELCAIAGQQLSRNAVIGKLHRMRKAGQIPEREEPRPRAQRQSGRKTTARSQERPPARPAAAGALALETKAHAAPAQQPSPERRLEVAAEEKGLVKDIMDLNQNTCRWPIGTPGEEGFCFCGRQPREGLPYCEHHAAVAYQSEGRRAAG